MAPWCACATKLHYIIRKAPFKNATLADEDLTVDFAEVTTPRDRVAVISTAPLTRDEDWTAGVPGSLWVFRRGRLRVEVVLRIDGVLRTLRSGEITREPEVVT